MYLDTFLLHLFHLFVTSYTLKISILSPAGLNAFCCSLILSTLLFFPFSDSRIPSFSFFLSLLYSSAFLSLILLSMTLSSFIVSIFFLSTNLFVFFSIYSSTSASPLFFLSRSHSVSLLLPLSDRKSVV